MKAQSQIGEDGLLMGAFSEEDLGKVVELIPKCKVVRFNCGHGIHIEKEIEFLNVLCAGE